MAEDKYNRKNPAVKRILQEVKEMQSNPSDDFMSLPLEENIFEWQFAIRGPRDSEFEGGIYHGRIQLPAEYPFKPPSFMLLTPNGRFETQTKICLSISNHHPEHWQPSWSVRTALVAVIAFMPTSPNGALGSLDYTKEERRALAIKSREASPKFGSPERQKLIDEIHEYMLSKALPVPQGIQDPVAQTSNEESEGQQTPDQDIEVAAENEPHPAEDDEIVEEPNQPPSNAYVAEGSSLVPAAPTNEQQLLHKVEPRVPKQADDRLLTWAAFGLTIAIVVLLLKKFMKADGHSAVFVNES
ncbi:ubiquitin-conjugating enzyme 32 [Perilla frutescens var. hirtella]|uniref:Ubiquitin-conjugating enzyme 32 n=1 Tax=Perilla frutescens var. hirtella TaxID=608512 RepID=A0AAD4NZC5_PERFH|nr:ubiquitin-conjugating enzyme 32 [Perilla frutescens var. hirtella]KAH6820257.1 ubiquitin-conjugating enzyme 32 [Perilla frutescens var. hirtella]